VNAFDLKKQKGYILEVKRAVYLQSFPNLLLQIGKKHARLNLHPIGLGWLGPIEYVKKAIA
jgi:hypothetical protein